MIYEIHYSKAAEKSIKLLKKSNTTAYKKVLKLIEELMLHPRTGTGHPEPLVEGNSITYSRSITKKNRLVYDIYDDKVAVLVLTAEGHYNDK
jgi:toxin YoeB